MAYLIAEAPTALLALMRLPTPRPISVPALMDRLRCSASMRYAEKALEGEAGAVAQAGAGQRHITLFKAAARIGELANYLDLGAATHVLTDAALQAGMEGRDSEIARTIRDGLAAGRKQPRVIAHAHRHPKPPNSIDFQSLRSFWQACRPIAEAKNSTMDPRDLAMARFLSRRNWWPPWSVDELGMLRVPPLPGTLDVVWPAWFPEDWANEHRLVAVAVNHKGIPMALAALSVQPSSDSVVRWAKGCNPRGLYVVNVHAAAVLRGTLPNNLESVVVTEGLERTVSLALEARTRGRPVAVLGVERRSLFTLTRVRFPAVPVLVDMDYIHDADAALAELHQTLQADFRTVRGRAAGEGGP